MSVDTLFDYLESAEGSEDLDALMAGELSAYEIKKLSERHSTNKHILWGVSMLSYLQKEEKQRQEQNTDFSDSPRYFGP